MWRKNVFGLLYRVSNYICKLWAWGSIKTYDREIKSICACKCFQAFSQSKQRPVYNIWIKQFPEHNRTGTYHSLSEELFLSCLSWFPVMHLLQAVPSYWRLMRRRNVVSAHLFYLPPCLLVSAAQGCHSALSSWCGVLGRTIVIKHISGSITTQMHSHQGSTTGSKQMVAGVR